MLSDAVFDRVLRSRGISRDIADERPYVPYELGARWQVLAADPLYRTLEPADKWFIGKMVEQQPGLVIIRHPFPGADPETFAELRPDASVAIRRKHSHPKKDLHPKSSHKRHLRKPHGPDKDGPHFHEQKTKYVFPPSQTVTVNGKKHKLKGERARRFDVHPGAALEGAPQGWIVLEGCLKADSLLTAGELAVTSVPSVTLWNAPEFDLVTDWAKGRAWVGVVSDSDWYTNHSVIRQSVECRDALRAAGVNADHVAPPRLPGVKKTGLDDFLALGRRPGELLTIELEVPHIDRGWIPGKQVRSRLRNLSVLEYAILHAAPHSGIFQGTEREIARALELDHEMVGQALKQLDGPLKLVERGEPFMDGLSWNHTAHKWWIVDEALRPVPRKQPLAA